MTYRLIDRCDIKMPNGQVIERGLMRQNGDTVSISMPEMIEITTTFDDGSEGKDVKFSGRMLQIDSFTDCQVRIMDNDDLVIVGASRQAKDQGKDEEAQMTTFTVTPLPGCRSCGQ